MYRWPDSSASATRNTTAAAPIHTSGRRSVCMSISAAGTRSATVSALAIGTSAIAGEAIAATSATTATNRWRRVALVQHVAIDTSASVGWGPAPG